MALSADAITMLQNLSQAYEPLEKMVSAICYLIGVMFVFRALYHLKIYGEMRTMMASNTSIKEPLMFFLAGSVFMYLPTAMDVMLTTVYNTPDIMAYSAFPGTGSVASGQALIAILKIIQLVGLIAFARGWMLITKAAGQGGAQMGYGKGLTHIIGGVLAINIVGTASIIANTLGVPLNV